MPRRRLMQRLIRLQRLADRAHARQPLSRRVTEMPRLARFVGLAPERSDARRWDTFRPRIVGDPRPAREVGPFALAAASVGETATPRDARLTSAAAWDGPPMATMPTVDDQPWEPIGDASPVASDVEPVADDLPALSARPYAGGADTAPLADVTPAPTPLPGSAPQDVALNRPQRTVPAPRERMGRRITEEIAQPVSPHVQPTPPASTTPAVPLPSATQTPVTILEPEPGPVVTAASADADNAWPRESVIAPGEHAVVAADRPPTASAASLPMVDPPPAPLVESTPRESFPVEEVRTRSLREAQRAEMVGVEIDAALPALMPPPERAADVPAQAEAAAAPRVTDDLSHAQPAPSQALPAVPVPPLPPPLSAQGGPPDRESVVSPTREPELRQAPSQPDRPGGIRDGAPPVTPDASALSAPPPDPPMTAAPPRELRADDLFLPDDKDRSPATWLARLTRAARPPAEPGTAPGPIPQQSVARPGRIGTDAPLTVPQPIPPPAPEPTDRRMSGPQRRFVAPTPYSRPSAASLPRPFGSATTGRESVTRTAEERPSAIPASPGTQPPQTAVAIGRGAETPQVGIPPTEERRDDAPALSTPWLPDRAEQGRADGAGRSPDTAAEPLARADPSTSSPSLAGSPTHAAQVASPLPPTAHPAQPGPMPGHPDTPIIEPPPTVPVPADAPAAESPAPAPLLETTRRFLHPLVGIDPGVAPVHRGAHAAGVAASYRADALTDGNVMVLAAGNDSDAPETLGLLAHELTHVARRRDARFIPPIARADDRGDQPPGGIAMETSPVALLADDETLARRVETRVVRAARADQLSQMPQPTVAGDRSGPSEPIRARDLSPRSEPMRDGERLDSDDWNGLPAPWEPLPDWMMAPAVASIAPTFGAVAPSAAVPFAPVAPVPQLAGEGHASEGGSPAAAPASAPHAPVEPDLDALARQVYGILKRRLALERRNAG